MIKPLVTIIVPVYNVEKYLKECLNSIRNQTYSNIEVILVDDGSKDQSGTICDDYTKLDKRFVTIHQNNRGVSSARNHGLEYAHGEWILFIDSDDIIDQDFIEKYVESIDDEVDIIYGGYKAFGGADRAGLQGHLYERERFSGSSLYKSLPNILVYCTPWGKFYKRSIVMNNHLRFEERLSISEDRLFLYQYLSHINYVLFFTYAGYNYRVSTDSLMNRKHPKEEIVLKMSLLWDAAVDIKIKWGLTLRQFVPLYIIHARDVLNSLSMDLSTDEKERLYYHTLGGLFPNKYKACEKSEQTTIKHSIGKYLFYSSFGYRYAVGARFILRVKNKIKHILG